MHTYPQVIGGGAFGALLPQVIKAYLYPQVIGALLYPQVIRALLPQVIHGVPVLYVGWEVSHPYFCSLSERGV